MNGLWMACVGAGVVVMVIMVVAGVMVRRYRKPTPTTNNQQHYELVTNRELYDARQVVTVPGQTKMLSHHRAVSMGDIYQTSHTEHQPKKKTSLEACKESLAPSLAGLRANSMISLTEKDSMFPASRFPQLGNYDYGSTTSLNTIDGVNEEYTKNSCVEMSLLWATKSCALTVIVHRVTSLPQKYRKGYAFSVSLSLQGPAVAGRRQSQSTPEVKNSLNPEFGQVFSFQGLTLEEVHQSEVLVAVTVRRRGGLRNKTLGELRHSLTHLPPDAPNTYTNPLTVMKTSSSTRPTSLELHSDHQIVGQLQILSQYQITGQKAARVKLMVCRAQNILLSKPGGEFRVLVVVRHLEQTVVVHETKSVRGPIPIWNTPFLFHTTQAKVGEFSAELTLVRSGRLVHRSTPLGRITLGLASTTPEGAAHWRDMIARSDIEVTVWLPLIRAE